LVKVLRASHARTVWSGGRGTDRVSLVPMVVAQRDCEHRGIPDPATRLVSSTASWHKALPHIKLFHDL